ncbi:hypothetical protein NEIFL0001_2287 [Neisseria flavescens SK114]|nr:hypothetical protein NEIFL0001_2287 [Neisseria flavescens SK114]
MGCQTGLIWNQIKGRLKTFQTAFFIHIKQHRQSIQTPNRIRQHTIAA